MKHLASLSTIAAVAAVLGLTTTTSIHGFSITSPRTSTTSTGSGIVGGSSKSPLFFDRASSGAGKRQARISATTLLATTPNSDGNAAAAVEPIKKEKRTLKDLRKEGGPFTVNTPIGALNPFAVYYFFISVGLGIPWVVLCRTWQFIHWITGNRFDPKRKIPIFIGHCWGMTLMRLTRCYPVIKNREVVTEYFKKNGGEESKSAMFVANHCSWMDIPFLGAVMGWRQYKIVSKKELGVVPILGTALYAGGHIMVDRTDRRSQIRTLKQGINHLKQDNSILATFPEGTRSRSGRMMKFKAGAFKMAHKAGAPVFPISIINSDKVMPLGWMMAMRPAYGLAEVVVHAPIASNDKTEEELVEAVRKSMIEGLPDDQKPLR